MRKAVIILMTVFLSASSLYAQKPKVASSPEKQCIATTKSGARCKLEREQGSKYCALHNPKARKCKATTKNGQKCTRNAVEGSDYCWQHQKK